MTITFSDMLARKRRDMWWYVAIEGIRKRFGTWEPGWNPADSGLNQHIEPWLIGAPRFGQQQADPLNGKCEIPGHSFSLYDYNNEITNMLAVSDTPKAKTLLTANIDADSLLVPVDDHSDFAASGHVYIGRETIHYSNKPTQSGSGTGDVVTGTADSDPGGASDVRMYDAARTEPNDYWLGGEIVFTSGSNSGQVRRIVKFTMSAGSSYHDYEEQDYTIYFDPTYPLPNNVTVGDTYEIRHPGSKLKDTTLSASDDYYNGAQVLITADTDHSENVGEIRYVMDYDGSDRTMFFFEPFPAPIGDGTSYSYMRRYLGSCTRGLYGSTASEHSVLDAQGEMIPIPVVDAPPFMKSRRAWVYTSFQGLDESESIGRGAVIDDYQLDGSGQAFTFQCSGLLKRASGKVLWRQNRGTIVDKPLWGGSFYLRTKSNLTPELNIGWWPWPIMSAESAGDVESNFSVTEIVCESETAYTTPCNIKIGDELIRVESSSMDRRGYGYTGKRILHLGEHVDFDGWVVGTIGETPAEVTSEKLCVHARGLFAEKIGVKPIASWAGGVGNWPSAYWGRPPIPPSTNAFMEEHQIGDEILQVMICDDTDISDFPRYDQIVFSGESGSLAAVGATITGVKSGVTATLICDDDESNNILHVIDASGEFYPGEQVGDGGSWTADVDEHRIGDGEALPARNHPLSIWLQLLCSTGTTGSNGKYDTLPFGWSVNPHIDESNIDISAIEQIRDTIFKSTKIEFCIHEPTSLKEWAEKNIFKYLQVFPYETYDGKLSLSYLYTEPECQNMDDGTLREIDADELDSTYLPSWNSGTPPVTKVKLKYNKHPVSDDYYSEMVINFTRGQSYYNDLGRVVELESDVLYWQIGAARQFNPGDPAMPGLVARMINPIWGRHSTHPAPSIGCRVDQRNMNTNIGDPVKYTEANIPNLRTGQRGMSGEYFQVVGIKPDVMRGSHGLEMWQVGVHDNKYGRKAPSAMAYSYAADTPSAGKSTITLYQSIFSRSGAYDRDQFVAGDFVQLFTGDTYRQLKTSGDPEEAEIESVGTGANYTLVLSSNLTYTPSQGDIVELARYDSCTSTRQSREVFHADDDRLLGSADNTAFKYR